MKAMVINSHGGPEVFSEATRPDPSAGPGQVVIKVAASSVNPIDTKVRSGQVPASPDFPAILHGDVAGVVTAVGQGVTDFQPGDEVYGCAGGFKGTQGALADFMLADARLLAHKPANLAMGEAAALPLVSITAWLALIDRAHLSAGQKVLIHGGTGGVGHIAIQLAKWRGAEVYTTVSSDAKAEIAHRLGADHIINYRQQDVADYVQQHTQGRGFDVVFDTVGGDNLDRSFEACAISGQVVAIAARSTHDLSPMQTKNLTLHVVFMLTALLHGLQHQRHGEILRQLTQLAEQDKVRPLLDDSMFPFKEVGQAHAHLESGQAIGKIVLLR